MATRERAQPAAARQPLDVAVASLKFTAAELTAVRATGYLTTERRGRSRLVYRLRFRVGKSQRSRCLGANANFARQIQAALDQPQAKRDLWRRLTAHVRATRQRMRRVKPLLAEQLKPLGLYLHGYRVRRLRGPTAETARGAQQRQTNN